MARRRVSRRTFLGIAASLSVATVTGCPLPTGKGITAYRRSGRGRHVSNAAKKHNANHLYATRAAALADPAHPGDHSKVVMITINRDMHAKLFPRGKLAADLRLDL